VWRWDSAGERLTAVAFQTAPTVLKRQQTKRYNAHHKPGLSESAQLLGDYQPRSSSPSPSPAIEAPPLRTLATPPVLIAVLNYALLALSDICLFAILPVFLASSPLSLTPRAIGVFLGGLGTFRGGFQALCTAPLVERWGAKRIYQVGICAYFPLWALFPIAVSMTAVDDNWLYQWSVFLFAVIGVILATIAGMAFSKYSGPQASCTIVHLL
jgi:hypothetical protein